MKIIIGCLLLCIFSCTGVQTKPETSEKVDHLKSKPTGNNSAELLNTTFLSDHITDPRDGETYAVVTIGNQIWMAESLRFNTTGSMVNPNYPSVEYGRLYDGLTAQTACPKGWHLPSDGEWNEMEMVLGMSADDVDVIGWRGVHGTMMKSTTGWLDGGNGTNSSGFNALPGGYFFDGDLEGGLGRSVGFWGAERNGNAWIRFVGGPLEGVNRMESDLLGSLACRCVKDK